MIDSAVRGLLDAHTRCLARPVLGRAYRQMGGESGPADVFWAEDCNGLAPGFHPHGNWCAARRGNHDPEVTGWRQLGSGGRRLAGYGLTGIAGFLAGGMRSRGAARSMT